MTTRQEPYRYPPTIVPPASQSLHAVVCAVLEPCRRAWHTTTFVPQRKMCLMFGGERQGDGAEVSEILAELVGFDIEQKVYFDCVTGGAPPCARTGNVAADGRPLRCAPLLCNRTEVGSLGWAQGTRQHSSALSWSFSADAAAARHGAG